MSLGVLLLSDARGSGPKSKVVPCANMAVPTVDGRGAEVVVHAQLPKKL